MKPFLIPSLVFSGRRLCVGTPPVPAFVHALFNRSGRRSAGDELIAAGPLTADVRNIRGDALAWGGVSAVFHFDSIVDDFGDR